MILTKIIDFAISKFANSFDHICYYSYLHVWQRIFSPKEKCKCLTLLLTLVIIAALCVICKERNQCRRWFDITQNPLHCNNSLTPDRSQQCHHNKLFRFSIVQIVGIVSSGLVSGSYYNGGGASDINALVTCNST